MGIDSHQIYHVTYVSLKDKSEEQMYVFFPMSRGEPVIERPFAQNKDVAELRKTLRSEGFKKAQLETIIEYHQKIYLPDPTETKEHLDALEKGRQRSFRRNQNSQFHR